MSEFKIARLKKRKRMLISRLSLALAAQRCRSRPLKAFRSCIRDTYPSIRRDIEEWVEKTIRGEPEKLIDIAEQL